jgi:hypothetical protein
MTLALVDRRGGVRLERRAWLAETLRRRRRELAHAILERRVAAGFVIVVDTRGTDAHLELVDVAGAGIGVVR